MSLKGASEAIIYAAKSTEDTRGSIPGQLADGRAFAAHHQIEVVAEYSEENVSAYSGNRGPELAAALAHAERISGVLIAQHSDRLARGDGRQARHLVEIALWARRTGVAIHCIEDPSTFENLVLAAAMGERNMEDSRRKSAAVAAGIARRRAGGRHLGATSFGFRLERDEHDKRVLVPDPESAPVLERIVGKSDAGGRQPGRSARRALAQGFAGNRDQLAQPRVAQGWRRLGRRYSCVSVDSPIESGPEPGKRDL